MSRNTRSAAQTPPVDESSSSTLNPTQSAESRLTTPQQPLPDPMSQMESVLKMLMSAQQRQTELLLQGQREERQAQREERERDREAQKQDREAQRAAQKEDRDAQLLSFQRSLESLLPRLPEHISPIPTPRRLSLVRDQLEQVPITRRSVNVSGGRTPPIYVGPSTSEVNTIVPLARSFPRNDRVEETTRDENDQLRPNRMCGDHLSRDEIPRSPPTRLHNNSENFRDLIGDIVRQEISAGSNREDKDRPVLPTNVESHTELVKKSSPIIRVQTFDGTTSWAEYECQFLIVAKLNGWNTASKAGNLAANLKGSALAVLTSLSNQELENYDKLSSALRVRFGDEHLQKLHLTQLENRRQHKDESLANLGLDIERMARVALPDCSESTRDRLACSRFINAVKDSELKHALGLAGPSTLREAVIRGLEIEAMDKFYLGVNRVRQIGTTNISSDNRNKTTPEQHRASKNSYSSKGSSKFCRYCKKDGHNIEDCYTLKRKNEMNSNNPQENYNNNQNANSNSNSNSNNNSWRNKDSSHSQPSTSKN